MVEGLDYRDRPTTTRELDGEAWLREQIDRGGPIVWSGYGLSLAVAEVLAAVSRELGAVSYALNPGDLRSGQLGGIAHLSRSAREPGRPVDLLVTETTDPGAYPAAARVLMIDDPDGGSDPWLPTRYARATVCGVAEVLGCPPSEPIDLAPDLELDADIGCLLLFKAHSRVVRSTLRAVREKIGVSPCEAMTFAELGHGFHGQLWAHPEEHRVWILCAPGSVGGPELAVRAWCEEVGVPVQDLALGESEGGALEVIRLFETTLALFERFARSSRLPLERSPIPDRLDSLRFA